MINSKVILVTGASGGFGSLAVKSLAKKGHTVYASMRDIGGKNKDKSEMLKSWAKENNAKVHIIELDVTNETSVHNCISKIITDNNRIDVVVNNAGVGVIGWQENFTPEDWQKIFDVNVFGMHRVNREVIPHMRKQKSGLLVHISSLLGRVVVPCYGPYNASKWAVEAMAENYRVELSSFGIESCIIEPGGFPTTFIDNLVRPSDKLRGKEYGDMEKFPEMFLENFEKTLAANKEQNPQNVADAIVNVVELEKRPFRTVVDNIGMGNSIIPYNEQLEKIMQGMYSNFKMSNMLGK